MASQRILIKDRGKKVSPSFEDIVVYSEHIGIDIANEPDLMWIAEAGLNAIVPAPWMPVENQQGHVYYYNSVTGKSTWEHPEDDNYRKMVLDERKRLASIQDSKKDFKTSLEPIGGAVGMQTLSRVTRPVLSSLADAPPLSPSGRSIPSISKESKGTGRKKIRMIDLDDLPDSKVTSAKLTSLNTSLSSQPGVAVGSLLPKDSGLLSTGSSKTESGVRSLRTPYGPISDFKMMSREQRSLRPENDEISDNASRYSYEETDYEEDESYPLSREDAYVKHDVDNLQLSPLHSSLGSPEPMDVNTLVALSSRTKEKNLGVPLYKASKPKPRRELAPLPVKKLGRHEKLKPIIRKEAKEEDAVKLKNERNSTCRESGISEDIESSSVAQSHMLAKAAAGPDLKGQRNEVADNGNDWQRKIAGAENEEKVRYERLKEEWDSRLKNEEMKLRKENEIILENLKNHLAEEKEKQDAALKKQIEELRKEYAVKTALEKQRIEEEFSSSLETFRKQMAETEEQEKKALQEKHRNESLEEFQESGDGDAEASGELLKSKQDEVTQLMLQLDGLRKSMETEETSFKILKDEIHDLQLMKETLSEETKNLQENINVLLKEKALIQKDIENLQEEAENVENEVDLLRVEKEKFQSELDHLRAEVKNSNSGDVHKDETSFESTFSKLHLTETHTMDKGVSTELVLSDASCQVDCMQDRYDKCVQAEMLEKLQKAAGVQTVFIIPLDKSCQTVSEDLNIADAACHSILPCESEDSQKPSLTLDKPHISSPILSDDIINNIVGKVKGHFDERMSLMEQKFRSLESKVKSQSDSIHDAADPLLDEEFLNQQSSHKIPVRENTYVQSEAFSTHVKNDTDIDVTTSCSCESGGTCKVLDSVKISLLHLVHQLQQPSLPHVTGRATFESADEMPSREHLQSFRNKVRELQERRWLDKTGEVSVAPSTSYAREVHSVHPSKTEQQHRFSRAFKSLYASGSVTNDEFLPRAKEVLFREDQQKGDHHHALSSVCKVNDSALSSHSALCTRCRSCIVSDEHIQADCENWMERIRRLQQRFLGQDQPAITHEDNSSEGTS